MHMNYPTCHHCDIIPEKNNLKGERFILTHSLRYSVMINWFHCLWVDGESDHHSNGSMLFTSWWPESRESEEEMGRGQHIPFKGMTPVTYFLQVDPTS
jgi:hypothetical protein